MLPSVTSHHNNWTMREASCVWLRSVCRVPCWTASDIRCVRASFVVFPLFPPPPPYAPAESFVLPVLRSSIGVFWGLFFFLKPTHMQSIQSIRTPYGVVKWSVCRRIAPDTSVPVLLRNKRVFTPGPSHTNEARQPARQSDPQTGWTSLHTRAVTSFYSKNALSPCSPM